MLSEGFEILGVLPRLGILDYLAETELGQLFRNKFRIEQAALHRGLVLDEASDEFIKILAAHSLDDDMRPLARLISQY